MSLTLSSSVASDYGVRLPILRSSPEDQILYQTERYNEDTFGYDVPIRDDGDYILVMKYAEVYFAQSQQKVWRFAIQTCCSQVVCVCLLVGVLRGWRSYMLTDLSMCPP